MKRHVSIFAFLLGTFVTAGFALDAVAIGTQVITGGFYYYDGKLQNSNGEPDITHMYVIDALGDKGATANVWDGNPVTFNANPDPGMKVSNWKVCYGLNDVMNITAWPNPPTTTTEFTLTADSSKGHAAYLAVNFTYIPLTVKAGDTTVLDSGTINATNIKLPTPTKTGYTGKWKNGKDKPFNFGGTYSGTDFWYEDEKERNFYATLTADWTANTYTIVFNGNGATGGSMSDMSCTYDQPKSLPKNTFTKTYYTFAGWKDGNGTSYSDGASVKNLTEVNGGTVTLYAQWTKNSYTVTTKVADVSSGKGVTSPASATQGGDTSLTITAAPNDGYAFAQWDDGSTEATRMVTVVSNANYTATFTNRVFTMTFDPNGDGATCDEVSRQIAYLSPIGLDATGQAKPLPVASWYNHTFMGWYTHPTAGEQITENTAEHGTKRYDWISDITLYAHWTEIKAHAITVTCEPAKGGSATITGESVGGKFVDGKEIVLTATPSNGYSFARWERGSNTYTDNPLKSKATESADYVAVFTANVYTVYFDANDGQFEDGSDEADVPYTYGQPFGSFPVCTREGYDLEGWFTGKSKGKRVDAGDDFVLDDPEEEELILYARWTKKPTYTIVFDGNGATNATAMADQTANCGEDVVLASNQYARTGYTFNCWTNYSAGTSYSDGATVCDLTNANETVELSAAWSPIPYTLAFDPQGGDFGQKLETQACIYDQEFLLRYTVGTRDLFDFGGWSNVWNGAVYLTKDLCKGKNAYDVPNGTNTLKAIWISRLTDYSRAMHCTNLVWDTGNKECWECIYDLLTPPNPSDSCVRGTQGQNANLSASLPGSGTLSFMWKSDKAGTSLIVTYGDSSTNLVASDIWQLSEIDVQLADAGSIPISLMLPYPDADCYIAQMTWTPKGSEPKYVDVDSEVTGFSMADRKLVFAFNATNDEASAYHLLGTNDLVAPMPWPMVFEIGKQSGSYSFEIPVKEDESKMFYRIRALK